MRKDGMIKFIHKNLPDVGNHWNYCLLNEIPHIEIIPKSRDYAMISYDLFPCISNSNHKLKTDVSENVINIYRAYADFYSLPKERFMLAGGPIALGFTVRRAHAEPIALQLFDYLANFIKKNKI